jgi:dihydroorotate dehydrogenase (NAD+) catalytic subunit
LSFGRDAKSVARIVGKVRGVCGKPLIVKLSPNTSDIGENALAAQEQGADMLSLINTVSALAIDYRTRKPILGNICGGLSGPAIKPIALNMVYQAYKKVSIPIIGMGGIACLQDVVEFMLAGASAVQIGTASLVNPELAPGIIAGLEDYCIKEGIQNIGKLTGALEV